MIIFLCEQRKDAIFKQMLICSNGRKKPVYIRWSLNQRGTVIFCLQHWKLHNNNPEWWFVLEFETKGQEAVGIM